jgi:hypothetical protein
VRNYRQAMGNREHSLLPVVRHKGSASSRTLFVTTKQSIPLIALVALTLLMSSCRENIADAPVATKPPQTFLWLYPDGDLATGVSRSHLRWWGESANGLVRGFLFSFKVVYNNVTALPTPDTLRYCWVTTNDTTLLFPMDTLFRKFAVVVRAVDNGFAGLPEHSIVRMLPSPYWDRNDNGVFDGDDRKLDNLTSAVDPLGAVQTFPIRNTPPTIGLLPPPNDPSLAQKLPDTTFTAVTIGFKGSDADGDNTLSSYRIALNDTTALNAWTTVTLRDTILTIVVPRSRSDAATTTVTADIYSGSFLGRRLVGQVPNLKLDADNAVYVEVRDVAGEYSPALKLPSGTDKWYVKKPRGRLLLVNDYIRFDAALAQSTYLTTLASVPGGQFTTVDQLNIDLGLTAIDKESGRYGKLTPQFADPALVQTFLLFDYVVWYCDVYPSLAVAQLSVFPYLQNGGRVIFSTMFQNTSDPRGALRDFAPIDSVSSVALPPPTPPPAYAGDSQIPANYILYADSSDARNIYPQLALNASPIIHSVFMRPIYRRSDARYLYHLQADTRTPQRYYGSPNMAVMDGQNSIIFVGLPLHLLNNTSAGNPRGLTAFFEKALTQFSGTQVVNRLAF